MYGRHNKNKLSGLKSCSAHKSVPFQGTTGVILRCEDLKRSILTTWQNDWSAKANSTNNQSINKTRRSIICPWYCSTICLKKAVVCTLWCCYKQLVFSLEFKKFKSAWLMLHLGKQIRLDSFIWVRPIVLIWNATRSYGMDNLFDVKFFLFGRR